MTKYTIGYMSMPKPAKFILSSDYATLANDSDTLQCVVSIPATSIGGSGTVQNYTNTVDIGTIGSPIEYDIQNSMSTQRWKSQQPLFIENTSTANQYQYYVKVYKSSATTVTVLVSIFRGGPGAITKTARTITVNVRSFIPPF